MSTTDSLKFLSARQEALKAIMRELEGELRLLDEEMKRLRAEGELRFSQAFFWEKLYPLLENGNMDGQTVPQLREKLSRDYSINPGNFRVFLHRQRERGLLDFVEQKRGPGRWRLTERARKAARTLQPGRRAVEGGSFAT